MKLNKSDLKLLIKECILEILVDAGGGQKALQEMKKTPKRNQGSGRRTALDNIKFSSSTPKQRPASRPQVDVSKITSDPVMAQILQDTARTTLVEQTKAERRPTSTPVDKASMIVANNDLGDIFGEAANNWATLAFSQGKPN